MQRTGIKSFILCVLFCSITFSQDVKLNVAVKNLLAKGIDKETADIITDRLRTELFKTGVFNVAEQGLQQDGIVDTDKAASKTITGTIGKVGSTFTLNIRLVDIETGKVDHSVNIDARIPLDDVLVESTKEIAQKLAYFVDNTYSFHALETEEQEKEPAVSQGKITVSTDPAGATVSIDGEKKGETPYSDKTIDAGIHTLMIEKQNYNSKTKSITIVAGELLSQHFMMTHTKAYLDTAKVDKKKVKKVESTGPKIKKKRKLVWLKIVLGLVTAGSGATGLLLNNMAKERVDECVAIEEKYKNGNSNDEYEALNQEYNIAYQDANQKMQLRNICYIISGAGAVGFAISFVF